MDLPRITDAPVTLHTFSGALAETSSVEADAEREALTALLRCLLQLKASYPLQWMAPLQACKARIMK